MLPEAVLSLLYDVSHNTCKVEEHDIDETPTRLFVHRKGATRAFGPGHPDIPPALRVVGQAVDRRNNGNGVLRARRHEGEYVTDLWVCLPWGAQPEPPPSVAAVVWLRGVVKGLAGRGILIRSPSMRGVAEEAPEAYKDVNEVVDVSDDAKLTRKVVKLEPLVCVKGAVVHGRFLVLHQRQRVRTTAVKRIIVPVAE